LRLFREKIERICNDPYAKDIDIQKLSWSKELDFRFRLGKRRFIYRIIENDLVVYMYDADSRWDIY